VTRQPVGLHHLFERSLELRPAATALLWDGGSLSYAELDRAANRLARHLIDRGLRPDGLAAVCLPRSADLVIAELAILKAGGAFVPLDPAYPAERLSFMLEDAGHPLVVRDLPAAGPDEPLPIDVHGEQLAYVIYTSGSTGRPKGIAIRHAGIVNNLLDLNERYAVGPGDRLLAVSSPSFDMSVYEVFGTLAAGATLVLPGPQRDFAELISRYGVTVWSSAPALLDEVVRTGIGLGSLRLALLGGDWVPARLPAQLRALAPSIRFVVLGGATEASIHSTASVVEAHQESIPYGFPLANQFAYVLDRGGRPVPDGEAGELHLGGSGLARGYWNRPDLTAERFVPNPFRPGERMYRTGDLVRRLPGGNLELLGRLDHQVKLRGVRIEPAEVENALEAHPDVGRAVVMVREDGPGARRLTAYVVPARPCADLVTRLRRHLAERLPAPLQPSAYVMLDALPLSPNGKVDRAALPPLSWNGRNRPEYAPPRTPIEAQLAAMWEEVLGLDGIGIADDFFELGGDSLLAMRLAARARAKLGREIDLRDLSGAPTIAALAEVLDRAPQAREIPATRTTRPRASFAQEALYYVEQLVPRGAARPYNEVVALRLRGRLDVGLLEQAVRQLVARHESLRTSFRLEDQLLLMIHPPGEVTLDVVSGVSPHAEAARPFDLAAGPLFRAQLVRLGENDHILYLTMHHLITDGWSNSVLVAELGALYAGAPPPAAEAHYRDFAEWQRAARFDMTFWRQCLQGFPTVLKWPAVRPALPTFRGARVPVQLDRELTAELHELAREENATLFVVLLAAFESLLHRWCGQERFLVGTMSANRARPEWEGVLGLFANPVVVPADLSGAPGFRELVARTRDIWLRIEPHAATPFAAVVDALQPRRDPSHNPLFQVQLVLHNTPAPPERVGDLRVELDLPDGGAAKFELTLSLEERGGRLAGHFEYATDLFDAATIERLAREYRRLLAGVVERPVPLLPDLLDAALARHRERVAIQHGALQLTYGELERRSNQLANHLRKLGVGPEVRVALCLERTPDLLVAILAVTRAGGAWVPLDPHAVARRLELAFEDCAAPVLITIGRIESSLPPHSGRRVRLDLDAGQIAGESATLEPAHPLPGHLAYLIYTSGSTGRPKAVMIEHGALANYLRWCLTAYPMAEGRGAPVQTSAGVDFTVTTLLAPLLSGGTVFLLPEDLSAFVDGLRAASGYSIVKVTPGQLQLLNEQLSPAEAAGLTRALVIGGEALRAETLAFFRTHAPHTRLFNEYGPTEATVGCCVHEVTAGTPSFGGVPIGRPIANTTAHVVDTALRPVPDGVAGELVIGGAGLGRGYHGSPDLTAERFIPDPFGGGRLYRTGDQARRRADGTLEFLGRNDTQVKILGYRVELGEIEAAVLRFPGVREAAVLQQPTGARRPIAYVSAAAEVNAAALTAFLKNELPSYMVPLAFLFMERLPRTGAGKVDRLALPAMESAGEPEPSLSPRNTVEQVLANVWTELLGLETVGVLDDFFDLGGNSLAAIRFIARLREYFHSDLTLRDFLQTPTVAGVAALLLRDPARREAAEHAARVILEVTALSEEDSAQRLRRLRDE
jgi:amino acid adenylation domain-containing protein